jgi:hypothetical protein
LLLSFDPLSALCAARAVGLCIENGASVMAVRKSAFGLVRTIWKVASSTLVTDLMSELSP